MTVRLPRLLAPALVVLSFTFTLPFGCSESSEVVFGVTSELVPGPAFTSLEARLLANGEEVSVVTFRDATLTFPIEIPAADLGDGTDVRLELTANQGNLSILTKTAETTAVAGRKILYEVNLDNECIATECDAGSTCTDGACASDFEEPSALPEYYPQWAGTTGGGLCEPGGDPEVLLGEGQSDYHDVADGDVLQVEAGPQGGFHVWIAARLKNLSQSGSLTSIEGHFLDLDYSPSPMVVIFTFDPDEGDYCKVYGLRFRLDDADHPVETLLGHSIELTLSITDPQDDTASATRTVTLSDDILE